MVYAAKYSSQILLFGYKLNITVDIRTETKRKRKNQIKGRIK